MEAVIIFLPTPEGILAEKMKKICKEEMKENNIRLTIQERGGRKLGHTLGHSVPGARGALNCGREKCNSGGKEGSCRKTGAGYRITCNVCEEEVLCKYEGETGRNLYARGDEHAQDVARKAVEAHHGQAQRSDGETNLFSIQDGCYSILQICSKKESKRGS